MNKALLLILDGWGYSEEEKGNAIKAAKTPCFDSLIQNYPNTLLNASSTHVGLPEGIMGNSEVGHENIGLGRPIKQKLTQISDMVKTGEFFQNQILIDAVEHAKKNNSKLHFMGLISEGDVHSHLGHLYGLIELAEKKGLDKSQIFLQAICDGRDDPPKVAEKLMERVASKIEIATVSGRYWAMDRDKNWERTDKYFNTVVNTTVTELKDFTPFKASSGAEAITNYYDYAAKNPGKVVGDSDEFVEVTVINENGLIEEKDSIIFFNFRPDRAIQISTRFEELQKSKPDLHYACFTEYNSDLDLPVAFDANSLPKQEFANGLGEWISKKGFNQFRVAETEKYPHVTFFINAKTSKRKDPFPNEDRLLIPSPKVATYDLQPEMSVVEVTDGLLEAMANKEKDYKLIICNIANPDMVGHTGNWDAVLKALEEVDNQLARIVKASEENEYKLLITADHGNADQMHDGDGTTRTAHSTNKVPFIVLDKNHKLKNEESNALKNIAPTILDLMNLEKPSEMTCESLLVKQEASV
ncbi:MAG: 2,3-bisphosphoglycerate-independent phosphoglycerate mutase [Candidatus Caenarcaniphilales bacterium]|nr:2,3-bisphosphoglycerate-independent phosphoglycerate mutase [Candidatus Caenarcaniphilales bacterium]